MITRYASIMFLLTLLVISCQGRAPQEVDDFAVSSLQKRLCQYGQCRDVNVRRSKSISRAITDADKANGIIDRWCVWVNYLYMRNEPNSQWQSFANVYEIHKRNETLEIRYYQEAIHRDSEDADNVKIFYNSCENSWR